MKRRSAVLALLCLLVLPDHVFAEGNGNGNNGNGNNGNGNGNSDNNNGNGDGNSGNGNSGNKGSENGNNGSSGNGPGAVSAERPSSAPEPAVELSENAALQAVEAGKAVPLQSLLPDVKSRTGGEIIDAQLQQVGGSLLYAIKVLTPDGRVVAEYYDARTGRHVE